MQIEEAKKELNNLIFTLEIKHLGGAEAINTLINYVETMQKEFDRLEGIEDNTSMLKQELKEQKEANKELNKVLIHFKAVINEMAKMINNHDIDEDICKQMGKKKDCNDYADEENCIDCIKEYFSEKVQK